MAPHDTGQHSRPHSLLLLLLIWLLLAPAAALTAAYHLPQPLLLRRLRRYRHPCLHLLTVLTPGHAVLLLPLPHQEQLVLLLPRLPSLLLALLLPTLQLLPVLLNHHMSLLLLLPWLQMPVCLAA
jgi:hypothetical protein